jgi:hypothetical protein
VGRPILVAVGHPHHPPGLLERLERLGPHAQLEPGQPPGLVDDEVEEIPLGHEGQEPVGAGQPPEVGQGEVAVVGGDTQHRRLLVGKVQQLLGQAELVEQPQGGRVQGVAAEVTQEVGMLLQHQDLDPGPGQQQPQHGPGRATAGDAAGDLGPQDLGRRPVPRRRLLHPASSSRPVLRPGHADTPLLPILVAACEAPGTALLHDGFGSVACKSIACSTRSARGWMRRDTGVLSATEKAFQAVNRATASGTAHGGGSGALVQLGR